MRQLFWTACFLAALAAPWPAGAAQAAAGDGEKNLPVAAPAGATDSMHVDPSSVHVLDADGDAMVVEAAIVRTDANQHVTAGRAVYRFTGDGKSFLPGENGAWKPVQAGSAEEVCADSILAVLNDPAQRARFVNELQQVIMKKWEDREAAKVKGTAQPAASPEAAAPGNSAAPAETGKAPAAAPGSESGDSPQKADAGQAPADSGTARTQEAAGGEARSDAPSAEPPVTVEITSHEPQVSIEALPSVEIRSHTEEKTPSVIGNFNNA